MLFGEVLPGVHLALVPEPQFQLWLPCMGEYLHEVVWVEFVEQEVSVSLSLIL